MHWQHLSLLRKVKLKKSFLSQKLYEHCKPFQNTCLHERGEEILLATNFNPNENIIVTEISGFRTRWSFLLKEKADLPIYIGGEHFSLPSRKSLIITRELEIIFLLINFTKSYSKADNSLETEHGSLDTVACQEPHWQQTQILHPMLNTDMLL